MISQKRRIIRYLLADWIEHLRRNLPLWIRKILPRRLKDILLDLEWSLYRSKNLHLKKELPPARFPILIISIPKCGTHLLQAYLLSLPGARLRGHFPSGLDWASTEKLLFDFGKEKLRKARPGHVFGWHVPFDTEIAAWLDEHRFKRLFIYRDPRGYTVSLYNFLLNNPPHPPPYPYQDFLLQLNNDSERLLKCISGFTTDIHSDSTKLSPTCLPNVNTLYRQFLGWRDDRNTLSLRFEDLVTDRSNHPNSSTRQVVSSMLEYLEVTVRGFSNEAFKELLTSVLDPKKSPTYRTGKKGSWREEYEPRHIETSKRVAGDLLLELGYEQNPEWSSSLLAVGR